jgi:hypothetical protein
VIELYCCESRSNFSSRFGRFAGGGCAMAEGEAGWYNSGGKKVSQVPETATRSRVAVKLG